MLDKALKAWECCNPFNRRCSECPYKDDCFHDGFDRVAIADMVKLLESQQAEITRLNDTLRIMFNRCICFCGSRNCFECKQKEECESTRSFWHGYCLLNGKRVKKDGET